MFAQNMYGHFSRLATDYNELRLTDLEPVLFIKEQLKSLPAIDAADIGCGAGRYDLLFFRHLKNLHLTFIDINKSMLEETALYLKSNGIINFKLVQSGSDNIPLGDESMDVIFTFNAVHHFNFHQFLENAARIIKQTGFTFIYTRLQRQNATNIWGRYFPLFLKKEKRLYDLDEMKDMIQSVGSLTIDVVKDFRYRRCATLEQLLKRVKSRHYSTFSLYSEDELKESLREFEKKITHSYRDSGNIEWVDENIMLVLRHRTN
ncbi:MAG: class I SAM-dependent methyltransferase [Nitrospiraceae bacterium]|nr:MAG: class I SAM-dependent methyltransferase [Nitrospiraceae bacterium]